MRDPNMVEEVDPAFRTIGYDGKDIKDFYKVFVTSTALGVRVVGYSQTDIELRTASEWQPLLPEGLASAKKLIGTVAEAVSGVSLVNKAFTRRRWMGSTPITMPIEMAFFAENSDRDVFEPCKALQQMSLPTEALAKFLAPPGPNPFVLNSKTGEVGDKGYGDSISIQLGNVMTFANVIIKDVSVKYPWKFGRTGKPIQGRATIVFETYEVMTKGDLEAAYN